jgi:hypothetical protein
MGKIASLASRGGSSRTTAKVDSGPFLDSLALGRHKHAALAGPMDPIFGADLRLTQ